MRKPLIGMTGGFRQQDAQKTEGSQRLNISNAYTVSILRAGGLPVVLPLTDDREAVRELIESVDGLLVTGGVDVNPLRYGEEPLPKQGYICSLRDSTDLCAIHSAAECHRPILGICRGLQSINVAFGGTLYQDLSYMNGTPLKHSQESEPECAGHTVTIKQESRLFQILGGTIQTNSFHHQAAKRVAEDFLVGATTKDGVVEEIEKKSDGFVVGIQWHPELMAASGDPVMQKIFNLFVRACGDSRPERPAG